jgi:hypothetical protein
MLTLKQCKEILADEAKKLTDQEITEMRDWLSVLAEVIIQSVESNKIN